ncbi:MAG: PilN domain-containing protein [Deltaproteobacteria bacterium]|nr:PilN domain-containing protein [Deltaproteobacteria bacterium]
MIRVNLLPVREARRQAGIRQQAMVLGISAGVGLLVCIWLQVSLSAKQSAQQRQIASAKAELKKLDATRKQVERFREEREEIERKLKVIDDLEKNRTGPVKIMDEIATRIPKRMWLTELKMNAGVMTLEGVSLDAEIVAAFLTTLAESPLISHVELDSTKLEERDGLKLNTFEISSKYEHGTAAEPKRGLRGRGKGKPKRRNRS